MAISAQSVNDRAQSVERGLVALRASSRVFGGSYVHEGERLTTGWHHHDLHQIEYAMQGLVEVESASGIHLLPPHQLAWIPAGCRHQTTLHASVTTISVLFEPDLIFPSDSRVRVLAASALIREMVLHSARWPISRTDDDPAGDIFFRALAHLVSDALEHETPLTLPSSDDPVVSAAMAETLSNLASASIHDVARSVDLSERTLRRRFTAAVGMPWRTYLAQARIIRSMALLADPARTVLDVALEVGFENVSSFARAFGRHIGEAPSVYRRRVAFERI